MIDKFNYLKGCLKGEALSAVAGLALNSKNYKEAIDILKDRFGNEQVLISAHMESLLRISKIKSRDNVKGLHMLYNHVESCVRNLKSLKLDTTGYRSLLIPILKDRLPDEITMIISRKFSEEIWIHRVQAKQDLVNIIKEGTGIQQVDYLVKLLSQNVLTAVGKVTFHLNVKMFLMSSDVRLFCVETEGVLFVWRLDISPKIAKLTTLVGNARQENTIFPYVSHPQPIVQKVLQSRKMIKIMENRILKVLRVMLVVIGAAYFYRQLEQMYYQ